MTAHDDARALNLCLVLILSLILFLSCSGTLIRFVMFPPTLAQMMRPSLDISKRMDTWIHGSAGTRAERFRVERR